MTKFQKVTGLAAALAVLCVNNSVDVLMDQSPVMWYVLNAGVVGFITLIIWEIVAERLEQSEADEVIECCGSGTCFICEGTHYWESKGEKKWGSWEENQYEPTQEDLDRTLNEAKQSWREHNTYRMYTALYKGMSVGELEHLKTIVKDEPKTIDSEIEEKVINDLIESKK